MSPSPYRSGETWLELKTERDALRATVEKLERAAAAGPRRPRSRKHWVVALVTLTPALVGSLVAHVSAAAAVGLVVSGLMAVTFGCVVIATPEGRS